MCEAKSNIYNKGTGAGGNKTTLFGKEFEIKTDIMSFVKNGSIFTKTFFDRIITFTTQSGFRTFMKQKFNKDVFRLPDEAYIIEYNNGKKVVKILEKKEQSVEGSVETKLWSCPSLKEEYEIFLGPDFEISYALCVNNFLKKKLISGIKKYEILNIILNRHGIDVMFGEDKDYNTHLFLWLGIQNNEFEECQSISCLKSSNKKQMTEQLTCEEYNKNGKQCVFKIKTTREDGKQVCGRHIKISSESKRKTTKGGETKEESKREEITKPILKWVGGKSQIINKLLSQFPTEINNYYEIFTGGGSVLLSLLNHIQNKKINLLGNIKAFDSNEALIYMYKNIQTAHEELYQTIQNFVISYNSKDTKELKEEYFYLCRNEYNKLENKKTILASALFIFLNKTCFRGLYREGKNGFNVPFGNYLTPEVINKSHLDEIHLLIQPVIFICQDFETSMTLIQNENDFVYLDPPYAPETSTSFVGYNNTGFCIEKHQKLFELTKSLPCKFILSNSDVELVRQNFTEEQYNIETILCKRAINSKNPSAKTNELIIKN